MAKGREPIHRAPFSTLHFRVQWNISNPFFFSFRGNTPLSLSPAYRTPIDKTRIGVLVREVSSDRVGIRPRGKANVRKRGRENRTFRARALLYPLPPRRRVRFVSLQSRLAPRAGSMRFITSLLSDNFFPLPKTDQR